MGLLCCHQHFRNLLGSLKTLLIIPWTVHDKAQESTSSMTLFVSSAVGVGDYASQPEHNPHITTPLSQKENFFPNKSVIWTLLTLTLLNKLPHSVMMANGRTNRWHTTQEQMILKPLRALRHCRREEYCGQESFREVWC